MTVRWLLVHPPLLGPAVLRPLAQELRRRGASVSVPDLRRTLAVPDRTGAVTAVGWPERWTAAAAGAGPADVVMGCSGAGATLPAVSAAVGADRVVWIDALVPARTGATAADAEIRALVAPRIRAGRIAEWTTWWGEEVLAELVPDPVLRTAILAEGHELPADFYEVAVPVPDRWPDHGARYVQLSPAYDGAAAEARDRGWTVVGSGNGAHLDVATRPGEVADLIG